MAKIQLLAGQKFGRLTFIRESENKDKNGQIMCWFSCDCGKEVEKRKNRVYTGNTLSCGCLQSEIARDRFTKNKYAIKHGLGMVDGVINPILNTYDSMKARCLNPNKPAYKYYGGRGITICHEWRNSYPEFHSWAISNGYKQGLQLDRIDNNGNYEPGNCRFVTRKENMQNTRANIWLEYNGERMVVHDLFKKTGIPYQTLLRRIRKGVTVEEAVIMGKGAPKKKISIFTEQK